VTLVVHALVLINIDSNMHGDEIKIPTVCLAHPIFPHAVIVQILHEQHKS
jgi:hypothetical protein